MAKYICSVCGYEYDEAAGDPDNGIAPGTKWEVLDLGACASALAAALFALSLKRLSRSTLEAILATRLLVCLEFFAIQSSPSFRILCCTQRTRTVLVLVLVDLPLLMVVLT